MSLYNTAECLFANYSLLLHQLYLEFRESRHRVINHLSVQVARANLEKKIAKTGFLLTVALLASFAPTVIFIFLSILFGFSNRDTYLWSVILSQLNSSASPILYFYRNRRFRNTVLQMLKIRKPHNGAAPKAVRIEKATNENKAKGNGKAVQRDSKNTFGTSATEKNNGRRGKSNSWGPVMFSEIQLPLSQGPRPKTAPTRPENGGTPKEEYSPVNQTSRCSVTAKGKGHTTTSTATTRTGLLGVQLPHLKENGVMKMCSSTHDSRRPQTTKGKIFSEAGTSYEEATLQEMKSQRSSIFLRPPVEVHRSHKDENPQQCGL